MKLEFFWQKGLSTPGIILIIAIFLAGAIAVGYAITDNSQNQEKNQEPVIDDQIMPSNDATAPTSSTPGNAEREDGIKPDSKPKTADIPDKDIGEEMMTPEARVFDISGANFSFSIKEIKVKKGDKVLINLTNTGGFHDLVIEGYGKGTAQISTGGKASVEFVADKSGTFEYYCSVGTHRIQGMVGKLIVE